ncbi:helix-turn-helix domain-containing protein [Amycolatopsis thailandensis]|uniref:helix-turn-helix domain-containing protein n=1 Tax=Amycolatopsis thailandensis TaxID=589330 RepID=UPI00365C0CC2
MGCVEARCVVTGPSGPLDPKAFGRRVAEARKATGMSQGQLAARLARSRAAITNIERGRALTSMTLLTELAVALKVSIDWLVAGVIVEPPNELLLKLREIRGRWQALLDANRELGWPELADVVRLPHDFVRDLDSLLGVTTSHPSTERT